MTDIDGRHEVCVMYHDVTRCVTDTPRYRAVCDGQQDNPDVTDTPRYITWCVTDIDGGQAVCDGLRDNPVVTNTLRYITQSVTDIGHGFVLLFDGCRGLQYHAVPGEPRDIRPFVI